MLGFLCVLVTDIHSPKDFGRVAKERVLPRC